MGLDVSAYKNLAKLDALFDEDGEPVNPATRQPIARYFLGNVNHDFPGREDDIVDRGIYSFSESDSFWSGGYGRYNAWREQLAKMAGYKPTPSEQYGKITLLCAKDCWDGATGPFSELINFSDCEGIIGPKTSAKLAKDFAEFDEKAKSVGQEFYERYCEWRRCFEFAAENGAVSFH